MPDINRIFDKFAIIENLPLFSELTLAQRQLVASRAEIVESRKGQIIYEEESPPDYFYCVVNGRVEIYHPGAKNKADHEKRIEVLRRGDYFGSISALTGHRHSVSARAMNDSVLLRIDVESFEYILRRVPRLAIYLSRSLSRRLREKVLKEVFESTIISAYCPGDELTASNYAADLAANLQKESGKKVLVVRINKTSPQAVSAARLESRGFAISNKKEVSSTLSLLTKDYHYLVIDMPSKPGKVNFEVLKQSDACHIITASDRASLYKASRLASKIENSLKKYSGQQVKVIVREDAAYKDTAYESKIGVLGRGIFATLPAQSRDYEKALRRIAREISGSRVGLALGSGAAMGLAHIGVLKVIEDEGIPIDIIAGTSMGAFVAALWAAGYAARDIEQIAFKFKSKLKALSLADFTLPVRGLIKGRVIRRLLKSYLGNKTFYDVKLPLKVTACDIKTRREVVIDKGGLVDAVMASIAIPGVFEPVELGKELLLSDGGIVDPVPVGVLSKLGIKKIIAVNALPSPEDTVRQSHRRPNIYDAIVNSFQAMEYAIAEQTCQHADVYLHPIAPMADWYEFYKAELFIKTGQKHTREALALIRELVKR